MDGKILNYEWDNFLIDCKTLANEIKKKEHPESLIIITRGGLLLGGMLAQLLDIKQVDTICIHSYYRSRKDVLHVIKKAKMDMTKALIVDDLVDSGETMKYVTDRYKVNSATLFYKPKSAIIKPTYYLHETDKWVKFPWESTDK